MYNNVGDDLFQSLQGMITGNVGAALGLLLVVLGIITIVVKKETGAGIAMIIGAALITLSPGIFNATRNLLADVIATVGGDQTTYGFQTRPTY